MTRPKLPISNQAFFLLHLGTLTLGVASLVYAAHVATTQPVLAVMLISAAVAFLFVAVTTMVYELAGFFALLRSEYRAGHIWFRWQKGPRQR